MRKWNVIKADMKFQWKYGFYFLYAIMVVLYLLLFSFFSGEVKNTLVSVCVYSDPAAMGMFFMGALILLEKSQRITNSIAISPVTSWEYILGKTISIGIISEIVGMILLLQGESQNIVLSVIGIFAGSVLFSLCGILVGTKIESLNQYIVCTIPFELIGFVPVILYRMGFWWDKRMMLIHPGCSVMQLLEGNTSLANFAILSIGAWIVLLLYVTNSSVKKMFRVCGETKL